MKRICECICLFCVMLFFIFFQDIFWVNLPWCYWPGKGISKKRRKSEAQKWQFVAYHCNIEAIWVQAGNTIRTANDILVCPINILISLNFHWFLVLSSYSNTQLLYRFDGVNVYVRNVKQSLINISQSMSLLFEFIAKKWNHLCV